MRRWLAGVRRRRLAPAPGVEAVARRIEDLGSAADRIEARLAELMAQSRGQAALLDGMHGVMHRHWEALHELQGRSVRQEALLRALAADEAGNRRRLWALRESADYAEAFTATEPLVTVALTVRDRAHLLATRSLPSVLAQSYERMEVLIVGDDAPPAVERVATSVTDPRVRFINLRTRISHPDPERQWRVAKTLPLSEAYGTACGAWILELDDDDALAPEAIAGLLSLARASSAEVAYGDFRWHEADGSTRVMGGFPPRFAEFSLSSALVHGGLRFFAREFHAADLELPGDWYRTERMLRAGVRFAHAPTVIFDYFPSRVFADNGDTGETAGPGG